MKSLFHTLSALWRLAWVRVAAVVVAFVAFVRAFDWRNCAVAGYGSDPERFFEPPDAAFPPLGARGYEQTFDHIAAPGQSLYAWTQLTLDIAFPLFYAWVIWRVLRLAIPAGNRYRRFAAILPVAALVSDLLENAVTAWLAWRGDFDDVSDTLVGAAAVFTTAKWLAILLAVATAVIAFLALHRARARRLLQHLFFTRVPLLLGLLVLGLSAMGRQQTCTAESAPPVGLPTVQNLVTLDHAIQHAWAVYCVFVACVVVIFCGTHLWRLAHMRIDTEPMGLAAIAEDSPATRATFGLSGFALALPLLLQLRLDNGASPLTGWLGGLAAGVATLFVVLWVRRALTDPKQTSSAMLTGLRKQAADSVEAPVSRMATKLFGPGFEVDDSGGVATGRLYRGHALAAAIVLVLFVGYLFGNYQLNPIRSLPVVLDVPPIGYAMLLIAFVSMILSNLTFILDRVRVPLVLAVLAWVVFWGNLPVHWYDTQHYFDVTFVPEGDDGPPTIATALQARSERTDTRPIVVVAAAGGGIQAAAWTAHVLQGLHQRLGREFVDAIHLVSATSGGSVGTYFFIEALRAEQLARTDDPIAPTVTDRSKYVGFAIQQQALEAARRESGIDYLRHVPKAASGSSLEATAWGLVFPDLQRFATPFLVWPTPQRTMRDRAWSIEQAWHRWRTCMVTDTLVYHDAIEDNTDCRGHLRDSPAPARLSDWWRGARDGTLPGVILNGTIIDDGEQFLASNLDLRTLDLSREGRVRFAAPGQWTLGGFDPALCEHYPPERPARVAERPRPDTSTRTTAKAGTSLSAPDPCDAPMRFVDMRAVTAARLSATFPYVTPVARARVRRDDSDYRAPDDDRDADIVSAPPGEPLASTPPWHVGDGGYFDNPGSVAVFRWIEAVRDLQRRDPALAGRRILLIQITPFPARPDREPPAEGQGWQASLLGPLKGMLQVRTSSQLARSDLELTLIEALRDDCFEAVEFRPPYEPNRPDPPLSWELSRSDRERIVDDWEHVDNRRTANYVATRYFNGEPARCGSRDDD